MRILLPPSEAKQPGGRGRPLRMRTCQPDWRQARDPVFTALQALCSAPDEAAAEAALLLPPSLRAPALASNRAVLDGPTRTALTRYRGVLYDGLGVEEFTAAQLRLAMSSVLIFSGLFGVLKGGDPVPSYRVPAKATLPGIGVLTSYWRPILTHLVPPLLDSGLIVDLRSTDYRAMWLPPRNSAVTPLAIRILGRAPSGRRAVISYSSKLHKGRLAAALLRRHSSGSSIASAHDVIEAWLELGGTDASLDPTGSQLQLLE